jgi:drug/metabolite transporter (DMT)-like permease
MTAARLTTLTVFALVAFAGNSLLCRVALRETAIDAASFTSIRLVSGALTLWLIARSVSRSRGVKGSWASALALFVYAAGFSYAYTALTAATGALLLFGAVQATMIGQRLWARERLPLRQAAGLGLAVGGLVSFLAPGIARPSLHGTLLMLAAGVAWGIYSVRGIAAANPIAVTAGNFLRAVPLAIALSLVMQARVSIDGAGIAYAVASGALTSGVGYVIWYAVLPSLKPIRAASVQLSVPVIAAFGGVLLLGEPLDLRLVIASIAVLGGIALTIAGRSPRALTAKES